MRRRDRLTPSKVRRVRDLVKKNYSDAEIARRMGVIPVTVGRIRRKEMYTGVR